MQATVTQQLADFKNGVFADLRKTGVLKSEKPAPSPTAPAPAPVPVEAPAAPSPVSGMTAAEVQTMMARQRAFDRAVTAAGLSDEQIATVEGVFQAVNPQEPAAWLAGFIKTMGLGKGSAPPPTQPEPPKAPPAAPAAATPSFSDKGPAATSMSRDPIAILQHNPLQATRDDYARLVAMQGPDKALETWRNHSMAFLQRTRVRPDGRR